MPRIGVSGTFGSSVAGFHPLGALWNGIDNQLQRAITHLHKAASAAETAPVSQSLSKPGSSANGRVT